MSNRERAGTVQNKKGGKNANFQKDLEMVGNDSPMAKTNKSKGASPQKAGVGEDEYFNKQTVQISRSHSLDESKEDPDEKLLAPTEQNTLMLRGRTSEEMYQKELSLAFPFLKKFDASRKSRLSKERKSRFSANKTSQRQTKLSEQLEFVRTSRSSKMESTRQRIRKQETFMMQTERLKSEQNLNPSQGFGLGIISFHQFIVFSGMLFLLLTLMHIPTFWILLSYDKEYQNLDGMNSAEDKSLLERLTLGNLGFASSECQIQSMAFAGQVNGENFAKLRCKSGVLTHLVDFGITTKIEDQNQCRKASNNICNKYLQDKGDQGIYKFFQSNCQGKDSCLVQNFDKYVSRKGDAQEVYACLSPESKIFFQYTCEHTEAQFNSKLKDANTLIMVELSCIAVVVLFIYFVKNRTHVLAKRYIRNHVQAMDYTMYIPISHSQLSKFDKEIYKPNSIESRGTQFQNYVTDHLSELTNQLIQKENNQDQEAQNQIQNTQITRVDLVFDNNNILKLLKKRGRAIMYEDPYMVQQYEEIINQKEYKDRQYFSPIVGAFVTYESKDDVMYIHKAAKKKTNLLGKKVKIRQANQPYQYTWENMAFTMKRRCLGFMCSMLLLLSFLAVAFTIQFKMQKTVAYFDNYERADCNVFKDSVAVANEEAVSTPSVFIIQDFSYVRFQREAYATWENFYEDTDSADMTRRYVNATLSCFCEIKYNKWWFLLLFSSYRKDGLDQSPHEYDLYMKDLQQKQMEDEVESNYICSEFIIYSKMAQNYYLFMSLVIFLFNLGLYEMTGPILSITGFKQRTTQQNLVSIIIMICLLIDTILIPVIIGANMVEYGSRNILDQIFTGKNTDFGKDWYPDVGYGFIITMALYILNPFFTVFAEWGDMRFRQWWRKKHNKKLKSKQDFNDMRFYMFDIGPVYVMDYKIASTTSLFFIAVVFGPLVPLLYPMALIAIILQYYIEVVSLKKFYKLNEARKQDEKMTLINIKMLLVAPLLGIAVTIWAYSNRQMFENVIDPIQSYGDVTLSHHLLTDKTYPNHPHIVLLKLGLVVTAIVIAIITVQQYFMEAVFKRKKLKDMPDYTDSLKMDRVEEMVQDEQFYRHKGGFSILPQIALDKLQKRIDFKDFDGAASRVRKYSEVKIEETDTPIPRKKSLSKKMRDSVSSSQIFGSSAGSPNQLVQQPCYQSIYDIEYQFQFNDKDPEGIKAIKLLLQLPNVQQDRLDSIKLNHYKYGKTGALA